MVIKSMSRKNKKNRNFLRLVKYIGKDTSYERISLNISTPDILDYKSIANEFKDNVSLCKRQTKESVQVYHDILSLHPDDYEKATPAMLYDLAFKWLEIRKVIDTDLIYDNKGRVTSVVTGGCLVWGNIHDESQADRVKNYHIHLMISPNKLGETKRVRLTKHQFRKGLLELEKYQQEMYPELSNSIVMNKMMENSLSKTKATKRSEIEKKMQNRLNKQDQDKSKPKRKTKVQEIREIFTKCLNKAKSKQELVTLLYENGLVWHERGKKKTISLEDKRKLKSKRYRLDRSLGQLDLFVNKIEEWEKINKRKKELQVTIDYQEKKRMKERDSVEKLL